MNQVLYDKLKVIVENGDTEEIEKFLSSEEGEEIRRELEQKVIEIWGTIKEIIAPYVTAYFKENKEYILSLLEANKSQVEIK